MPFAAGETLSLVGESGAGKTTVAKTVLLLEKLSGGKLLFHGKDVESVRAGGAEGVPLERAGGLSGPVGFDGPAHAREDHRRRAAGGQHDADRAGNPATKCIELLAQVGLRPDQAELYPHEFSGGQRQRIAVARALALNPRLVVLDEPVSALDVSIRAQIMNLLKDIQTAYGLSYLLIAHNLATVRYMSHAVAIMYLGEIVEYAEGDELFEHPLHPYTKALMSAALPAHPDEVTEEIVLSGEMPSPLNPPRGCHFHPRCPAAMDICRKVAPR